MDERCPTCGQGVPPRPLHPSGQEIQLLVPDSDVSNLPPAWVQAIKEHERAVELVGFASTRLQAATGPWGKRYPTVLVYEWKSKWRLIVSERLLRVLFLGMLGAVALGIFAVVWGLGL
jgi:hypothetical protein